MKTSISLIFFLAFFNIVFSSPENEKIIWDYMKEKGFTDAGVAGLMGNINGESSMESVIYQHACKETIGLTDKEYVEKTNDGTYTNFVHDGCGFGLVQWTYYSRKEAFLKLCKEDIGDIHCQLDFLYQELENDFPHVLSILTTSDDVKECCHVVFDEYEGPHDESEPNRYESALGYYEAFKDGGNGQPDVNKHTYRIEPGDTLGAIAAKFNTTVEEICELNNIEDPNMIYAGQMLKIPYDEEEIKNLIL